MKVIVALDDVRSAHNVGAIFRTCDGAGVEELILGGITPYPPHNKIPKTALGAEESVKWIRGDLVEILQEKKKEGYSVISVEQTENSIDYKTIDYPEKIILVFGHEITGVSQSVLNISDKTIELPMKGIKESLNVATSVGIISYHLI